MFDSNHQYHPETTPLLVCLLRCIQCTYAWEAPCVVDAAWCCLLMSNMHLRCLQPRGHVDACVCCRWDVDSVYHPAAPLLASGAAGSMSAGQVATRFGTYLPDIHSFDPTAFGLSAAEATVMVSPTFQAVPMNLDGTCDVCAACVLTTTSVRKAAGEVKASSCAGCCCMSWQYHAFLCAD